MNYLKSKSIFPIRLLAVLIIVFMTIWLMPVNFISANDDNDTPVVSEPTDLTPPVIALIGDNPVTVEVGSLYIDKGANAIDEVDGDLSESIVVVNSVDTSCYLKVKTAPIFNDLKVKTALNISIYIIRFQ